MTRPKFHSHTYIVKQRVCRAGLLLSIATTNTVRPVARADREAEMRGVRPAWCWCKLTDVSQRTRV